MTSNPFATPKEAPTVEKPVVPAVDAADAATSESEKKKRKAPNKASTMDQKKFIIANYATMGRNELAEATGLTGQQVYNVVRDVREQMKNMAAEARKAGDEAKAATIENKVAEKLPKKVGGGRTGGGGSKKKEDIKNIIDDLLAA